MPIRRLALFALVASAALASASPNAIVNGSFENVALPGQNWGLFDSIDGWTATSGKIEVGNAAVYGVTGQTDQNVLELDADQNSTVTQTLDLAKGDYRLDFDYARRNGTSDETNAFDVLWNGQVVASVTPSLTAFTTATYTVSSAGGANALSFRATGANDSYGGMIDNVRLQTVPEPASMGALGVGVFGLLKRRKKA